MGVGVTLYCRFLVSFTPLNHLNRKRALNAARKAEKIVR